MAKKLAAVRNLRNRETGESEEHVLVPWHRGSGKHFDKNAHFLADQQSPVLGRKLKSENYVTFTTDDADLARNVLGHGYDFKLAGHPWDGKHLTALVAPPWHDQGKFILLPPSSRLYDLHDIGFETRIETDTHVAKLSKAWKRVTASSYVDGRWGRMLDLKGNVASYRFEGIERIIKCAVFDLDTFTPQQKAMVDGLVPMSPQFWQDLYGRKGSHGSVNKVTHIDDLFMLKGLGVVTESLAKGDIDFVGYGPKGVIGLNEVFFGSMGGLKVGDSYTNRQTLINVDQYKLVAQLTRELADQIIAHTNDEDYLRILFMALIVDPDLQYALENDLSPLRWPWLKSRCQKYVLKEMFKVHDGRVPMFKDVVPAYVIGDITCIDPDGTPHPERSLIGPNEIVLPAVKADTNIASFRSPTEPGQMAFAKVVYPNENYRGFANSNLVITGQEPQLFLDPQGGADNDGDLLNIVHSTRGVEVLKNAPRYPEVKPKAVKAESIAAALPNRATTRFTVNDAYDLIDRGQAGAMLIGMAANYQMAEFELSVNRQFILKDKAKLLAPEQKAWLKAYKPFQSRFLELGRDVIDASKTAGGAETSIKQGITDWWERCLVLPKTHASRIPQNRLNAKDLPPILLVDTPASLALDECNGIIDRLVQQLDTDRFAHISPLPIEPNGGFRDYAKGLRVNWANAYLHAKPEQSRNDVYREQSELLEQQLSKLTEPSQNATALEIWRQVYAYATPGKQVNDGIAGTRPIMRRAIKAMAQQRLTGLWVRVDLEYAARLQRKRVEVSVVDGQVMRTSDDTWLGAVEDDLTLDEQVIVPNGDYIMVAGRIRVKSRPQSMEPVGVVAKKLAEPAHTAPVQTKKRKPASKPKAKRATKKAQVTPESTPAVPIIKAEEPITFATFGEKLKHALGLDKPKA